MTTPCYHPYPSPDVSELDRKKLFRSALADAEMAISMSTADATSSIVRGLAKYSLQYPTLEVLEDLKNAKDRDVGFDPLFKDFAADIERRLAPAQDKAAAAIPVQAKEHPLDWKDLAGKAFFGFAALVFLGALYRRVRAS